MIWSFPWIFHCVGTLYGQMAEMYLLIWTCVCMIRLSVCFVSFLSLIQPFTGSRQLPPYFRLILTFSYCLHEFLREEELVTNRSPDTDMTDSFYDNDFTPDILDAMELWALRPHPILEKVISVCRLLVFFHQYVVDIRERKSENIFRTASTSPLVFNMTVMSSSGVIVSPSDVPVRNIQPLTAMVSSTDAGSTVTPFIVPPLSDIE